MTFPPNNPGYPPGSYGVGGPAGPGGYPPVEAGPSKLPALLSAAVVALGLFAFLFSFGPLFKITADVGPFGGAQLSGSGSGYPIIATLIAALLAAVGLLPKGTRYHAVVAVAAVLAVLLTIAQMVSKPAGFSIGGALWLILLCTLLQAFAAVAALLFEADVIALPTPRPTYDPYGPYGPPPGGYFSPQPGQQGPAAAPRPSYPPQYGGFPPAGPPSGGFGSLGPDNSPPTPPTGFPSFSPPRPNGPSQQPTTAQPTPSPEPSSGSTPS